MKKIAEFFKFEQERTNWRIEVTGGATTFMTMAYIVVVNPAILSDALGKEMFGELLFATCAAAALATLLMGLLANYPFALAPGMGLNAFFAYTIVLGMGVDWKLGLGVVLASGLLFLLLTVLRVRELIINAVPDPLKRAVAAGIGLFIAFIGLKNAGLVVDNQATLVSLGDVHSWPVGLALLGLLAIGVLMARGIRGAILLGMMGVTLVAMIVGATPWPTGLVSMPVWPVNLFGEAVRHLPQTLNIAFIEVILALLFVDLFDTMGTLLGLSERSGFSGRARKAAPSEPRPAFRFGGDRVRQRHRHVDGNHLHRERRRDLFWRSNRILQRGGQWILHRCVVPDAAGSVRSRLRRCSGAGGDGCADDGRCSPNQVERRFGGRSGFSHPDRHPADLQHRRWIGSGFHLLSHRQAAERTWRRGALAGRRPGGRLYRQVRFYRLELGSCSRRESQSVIFTKPSSLTRPMSPVAYQPSRITFRVRSSRPR